jgi:CRP-like cAMP-binding protein
MAALPAPPVALDLTLASANRMLASLSPDDQQRLLRSTVLLEPDTGEVLYEAGEPIAWVFFPLSCVVSILTVLADGSAVETQTIGREGMVGTFQALGDDHSPNGRAIVQMAGQLLRVDAAGFRHELQRNPLLVETVQSHLRALVIQVSQSVACAAAHTIRERLARWLLQTSDRVASDDVRLTHDFLAQILHTRRPSVTVALRELQQHGAVATRRGGTTILDREALESLACECYGLVGTEYARLIPGKPPAP